MRNFNFEIINRDIKTKTDFTVMISYFLINYFPLFFNISKLKIRNNKNITC